MHLRLFLALPLLALGIPALGADEFLAYFGTHTSCESRGIHAYRFDAGSGKLASLGLAAETENPFFLAIHPNGRYLYSVSEPSGDGGETAGAVSAFAIDKNTGNRPPDASRGTTGDPLSGLCALRGAVIRAPLLTGLSQSVVTKFGGKEYQS